MKIDKLKKISSEQVEIFSKLHSPNDNLIKKHTEQFFLFNAWKILGRFLISFKNRGY